MADIVKRAILESDSDFGKAPAKLATGYGVFEPKSQEDLETAFRGGYFSQIHRPALIGRPSTWTDFHISPIIAVAVGHAPFKSQS